MGNNTSILDFLKNEFKKEISGYDTSFLNKSVTNRITETKCESANDYLKLIKQSQQEKDIFIQSLNISYSEFFRNGLTFSVLEQIVLPILIHKKQESKRKEIRIWSAACAGGQEAYSLAMLMEELRVGIQNNFSYRIFASDQNKSLIDKSKKGQYPSAAITSLSIKRAKQWFTKNGDLYSVKPILKKNVDFSVFDLFNEKLNCPPVSIFGDFDLVFCSNLLFYYKPEFRKLILEKAIKCLATGGLLITGEAEREILINSNFQEVYPQSAIFKIK